MVARALKFRKWWSSNRRQRARTARARSGSTRERPHVESLEGRSLLSLTFNNYPLPDPGWIPTSITAGPDGNVWFTSAPNLIGIDLIGWPDQAGKIGKITPGGQITEYSLPARVSAGSIVTGPDGNLWFTEYMYPGPSGSMPSAAMIGRMTPSGQRTDFPLPGVQSAGDITDGPDGNLWFVADNSIDRITPQGVVTSFPVHASGGVTLGLGSVVTFPPPSSQGPALTGSITAGPDGNLWFAEWSNGDARIGRITPQGVVTEFAMPSSLVEAQNLIAGPDGNVWFTEAYMTAGAVPRVGRITPDGVITEFSLPAPGALPGSMSRGNNHDLWFIENLPYDPSHPLFPLTTRLVRLLPDGSMTEYDVPPGSGDGDVPNRLTLGPDGNLWLGEMSPGFSDRTGAIGQAVLPPPPPVVAPPQAPSVTHVNSTPMVFHETAVTLTINGSLTMTSAQNVHNYLVVPVLPNGHGGIRFGAPEHVDAALYSPAAHKVTLFVHGWLSSNRVYQVIAQSSGLVSPQGLHLAGNPLAGPGSSFVTLLPSKPVPPQFAGVFRNRHRP